MFFETNAIIYFNQCFLDTTFTSSEVRSIPTDLIQMFSKYIGIAVLLSIQFYSLKSKYIFGKA
jgi:hypothetical protein